MRQWDIFLFPFTEEQPHPVVILSTDERAAARKHVTDYSVSPCETDLLDCMKCCWTRRTVWIGNRLSVVI